MNACSALPATPVALIGGLMYRIVAFLALRIQASGLGTTSVMTPQTRARIVAFSTRLLAFTRNFARLAERARMVTRPVRHAASRREHARRDGGRRASSGASRATRAGRETFGWMVEFVPAALRDEFVALMASGRLATLIEASPQAARELRWLARGLGVVLPAGCFPTAAKFAADASTKECEPAGDCAVAARGGQGRDAAGSSPASGEADASARARSDYVAHVGPHGAPASKPALMGRLPNQVSAAGTLTASATGNARRDPRPLRKFVEPAPLARPSTPRVQDG